MPAPFVKLALAPVYVLLGSFPWVAQLRAQVTRKPEFVAGMTRENPRDGLKYNWIPPGTFQMGCSPGDTECSPVEKPAHRVTISRGFWVGQTEVTVGAYKRFAATSGRQMPSTPSSNKDWTNDKMPIVNVSWDDAQAYCKWAGGRLPTQAQWEYAARGGSTKGRYGPLDDIAWYADNSGRQRLDSATLWDLSQENYLKRLEDNGNGVHQVGQKRPNGYGLYDMLGNVWEWASDTVVVADLDLRHKANYHVLRGGGWRARPWVVRVSDFTAVNPGERFDDTGLRCVLAAGGR